MAKQNKRTAAAEDRELDEAFHNMTGRSKNPEKTKQRSPGVIIAVCSAIIAILLCIGAGIYFYWNADMDAVIAGNVSVAGVNLQGMTQRKAIETVKTATNGTYGSSDMTVTVGDHTIQLPSNCVTKLYVRKAVQAAYNLGAVSDLHILDLTPYLDFDETDIRNRLSQFDSLCNGASNQTTYQISGDAPNLILKVSLGTPEYGLDMEQLYDNVMSAYSQNRFTAEAQCATIEPELPDLEAIRETYCKPAADAYYDKTAKQIVPAVVGYGFDLDAAYETLKGAAYGTTVEISFTSDQPAVTEQDVSASLFKDTLATFTATSSSKTNRDTNLKLACEAINGTILHPGDTFSYNGTLGERTAEKGYRPAASYSGNETVDTIGGGICQVSSCLYYCVVSAELTVIERKNHGFLPAYMPSGADATVNWGTIDFRFKNELDYPVRIDAVAKGGKTTISLMGTETRNYRTELKSTTLATIPYETEYQTYPADNKEGFKDGQQLVSPYKGRQVETYLYKYDLVTGAFLSKEYIAESNYRKRNAVVCKIETASPEPTTPEETVPDTTEPPTVPETTTPPSVPETTPSEQQPPQ